MIRRERLDQHLAAIVTAVSRLSHGDVRPEELFVLTLEETTAWEQQQELSRKAAAEMRGEKVTYTAPWITEESARPVTAAAANGTSKQFQFVTALGTIEQFF